MHLIRSNEKLLKSASIVKYFIPKLTVSQGMKHPIDNILIDTKH